MISKEEAYEAYNQVRQSNPSKEKQLSENFEGCQWFADGYCWFRENGNGKRVEIGESRHSGLEVRVRFNHDGKWYTSERHSVNG